MQIVIEIDEARYKDIQRIAEVQLESNHFQTAEQIIAKGVPIEQKPKTDWIPVSERLPEDGTWNLFTDGNRISVERYKADAIDHFYPNGRWFSLDDAIAWVPLPEPYKAESEEQDARNNRKTL